jgi:MFS transporter, DHA1 family, multidrug resistance protein
MTPEPSKKNSLKPWQKNLWIIFFAQVTTMIGFLSIFPFLPFYIESIGKVSPIKMEILMGLVYSGQAFTMMIASPIWGNLADRFGRKLMVGRWAVGGRWVGPT